MNRPTLFRAWATPVSGLASPQNYEGGLTVTHDLPPEVHITHPEHDSAVAMDFKLQAQIEASDDYGLTEIRLHHGVNGVYGAAQVFIYTGIRLDSRETSDIDFAAMGAHPGDVRRGRSPRHGARSWPGPVDRRDGDRDRAVPG